jgi:hypothetical protein
MCVYAVLDVLSGCCDGETIEIKIDDPSTEVTANSGSASPGTPVEISGTTTLNAVVVVSTSGTQTAQMGIPSADQYVGGKFIVTDTTGSRNVTGITITENGTVDALNDLDNIKLYYELDTSAPYDCASES